MTGVVVVSALTFVAGDDGSQYAAPGLDAAWVGRRVEFVPTWTPWGARAGDVRLAAEEGEK